MGAFDKEPGLPIRNRLQTSKNKYYEYSTIFLRMVQWRQARSWVVATDESGIGTGPGGRGSP